MSLQKDSRHYPRFRAKERAYALLKPYCDKLGQIKDISTCGLSFEYLDIGKHTPSQQEDQFSIDIILTNEAFYLSQVPCQIVYDSPSSWQEDSDPYVGVENRRCGLRFIDMNHEQQEALDVFLGKHVVKAGPA